MTNHRVNKYVADGSGGLRVSSKFHQVARQDNESDLNIAHPSTSGIVLRDEPPPSVPDWIDDMPLAEVEADVLEIPKKRKRTAGDRPLLLWLAERDDFLQELLRSEGRGDYAEHLPCHSCPEAQPTFRCEDCFGRNLYCHQCIVNVHTINPLHRIQQWTGLYFECVSLKKLGLRIQLGHSTGDKCVAPTRAHGDDFTVVDSHGIHEVALDFCGCERMQNHTNQLLRMAWFPSTTDDPKTAATFRVLEQFHLLSFESKVSSHEFYHALARLTDNTGLNPLKDRYDAFMRMVREWRHLKMLKRAGRGHDPHGSNGTKEGECAVLCPACPHPDKNLPDDWQNIAPAKQWLYGIFIAIDANFRLKRKAVSSDSVDPSLSRGWAYFVEEGAYKSYLRDRINDPQETSTCSGHSAVNDADTKSSRGLAATGVGTVDCARHNMKLPNGVGDLQKGEKYVNMDYMVFSALRNSSVDVFNISYDIACQWHKNLWKRMTNHLPFSWQLDYPSKIVTFFVPKFHLPAHIAACHTVFSFNFIPGVGRTDGEAPERGWANINPVASSTKEMGPGNRRDTLDDHFGDWNWKKVVALGKTILRKIKEGITERNKHCADLVDLERAIPADSLARWKQDIEEWENDQTKRNPFDRRIDKTAVRLELARTDAENMAADKSPPLHSEITPSMLITAGLDLEEQQRRLRRDASKIGQHATDLQKTGIQQRSNALTRRIEAWSSVQALYIPEVVALRRRSEDIIPTSDVIDKPEDMKLWLPSEIGAEITCGHDLRKIEWRLRYAQAHDALEEVRRAVRLIKYILTFKDRNSRGQKPNTRSRSTLNNMDARCAASVAKYRAAYAALMQLNSFVDQVGWQNTLRPLNDEDIQTMGDLLVMGEGRRRLSWIWMVHGVADDSEKGLQDALRVEWCKARARAARWSEEVELLFEEKRRILQFFDWEAHQWDKRATSDLPSDAVAREGYVAYAFRQAALRRAIGAHFAHLWRDTQRVLEIANEGRDVVLVEAEDERFSAVSQV
ncbi:hypothetical protein BJ138DRAFT_1219360 [Hygrophoropsis aurantiaca]|uniref:Uncharacterized protein n=1 Tax=Hygrophoropsis aurantiaca TaxID=72124 RepID=A0ACB8A0X9_9AGAM|nr:hypothetical protein BJ138DRAFT_1219360 [Hygrophoropsis aurantiaca]